VKSLLSTGASLAKNGWVSMLIGVSTAAVSSASTDRASANYTVVPDGAPLHTAVIQRAIDACAAAGGGRVVLPAGNFRAGTIFLRSGVTLHLDKGAVLAASPNMADYVVRPRPLGGRLLNGLTTALLIAEGAEHIGLTGEGTIDGNGRLFCAQRKDKVDWVEEKRRMGLWIPGFDNQSGPRPRALLLFSECRDVRLSGVRLTNAPSWMVHLLACSDVAVSGVRLRGLVGGSNTDGFDLEACSDVRIEDCDIETGDDAISLKCINSWGLKRPSRRITVQRCRLASTTHGFTIGTETQDDFEDITLADSTIEGVAGHRVLTGVGLNMVDGAQIRGVTVSNVTIADAIAPVQVRLANAGRGQAVRAPGAIRDIVLERVTIRRAGGNCLIDGLPGHPLQRIVLRQVALEFADATVPRGEILGEVPEFDSEFPPNPAWRLLPAYGFYFRHVDGLELDDVTVTTTVPESRPALALADVANCIRRDVRTPAATD
jgi:polygalacturonase